MMLASKKKMEKKSGNDISGEYRSSKYAVQICSEIFILVQHLLFLEKCQFILVVYLIYFMTKRNFVDLWFHIRLSSAFCPILAIYNFKQKIKSKHKVKLENLFSYDQRMIPRNVVRFSSNSNRLTVLKLYKDCLKYAKTVRYSDPDWLHHRIQREFQVKLQIKLEV